MLDLNWKNLILKFFHQNRNRIEWHFNKQMPKVTSIPKSGFSSNIQIYVVMLKRHKNEIIIHKREKVNAQDRSIYLCCVSMVPFLVLIQG